MIIKVTLILNLSDDPGTRTVVRQNIINPGEPVDSLKGEGSDDLPDGPVEDWLLAFLAAAAGTLVYYLSWVFCITDNSCLIK